MEGVDSLMVSGNNGLFNQIIKSFLEREYVRRPFKRVKQIASQTDRQKVGVIYELKKSKKSKVFVDKKLEKTRDSHLFLI